jgi:PAS domain S-box-containing protein
MDDKSMLAYYKQAYEELEVLLDNCFDQITIANEKGIFTKVSKSCEKNFGLSENKIVGSSAFDLEEEGIFNTSITVEVLRKGTKTTLIQKTAANKILMVTGFPMFDKDGNIVSIINISRDITETERLKTELESIHSELQWVRDECNRREKLRENKISCKSSSMAKVLNLVNHIANSDATILLLGETGVGKGYMAKTIHNISTREKEPFISINCGAIPENLLESELFGYESGAFTGASKGGKKGLFEIAGNGTIFLDEIGDMPLNLQVKLLHVMDSKEIYRVAASKPIKVHARIIAATNKDLKKMILEGKFREDLYYRLNVVPITIPPLRDRKEDIPNLIKTFLEQYNDEYKTDKTISSTGCNMLINYDYKGNIRELENIIERLVITTTDSVIDENHILGVIDPINRRTYEIDEIIPIKEAVENLEKSILTEAFRRYKTTRKVAEVLNIDQSTVVKKAKKLNVK